MQNSGNRKVILYSKMSLDTILILSSKALALSIQQLMAYHLKLTA